MVLIMKTLCDIPALVSITLLLSALPVSFSHAQAQQNKHSYDASLQNTFSFEEHAHANANTTWAADKEVVISVSKLQSFFFKAKSNSVKTIENSALKYNARVSDTSFGIEATFSF